MRICDIDVKDLKKKYGTPLYIYDINHLKNNMRGYLDYFKSDDYKTEVLYASKAFSIKEVLRIAKSDGMSLDCVSLGELYTAKSVEFDFKKIYFHGNNKTKEELEFAIGNNVGIIVVDNLMELEEIESIANERKKDVNVIIRINSGVSAHTHKFIVTSHIDSKFGVLYKSDDYDELFRATGLRKSQLQRLTEYFIKYEGDDYSSFKNLDYAIEKFNQDHPTEMPLCRDGGYL